ncbi:chemotaxis protein [Brevibacillus fluminis]|uniref:Chemotaxis protein n=1 Tax=Brevibacillus fluminis TaxID=511487 RepID=A0A3M8E069_9BACL|nr:flagellar motor protein MotB [Brevibacillus fluminis]RNB92637.1 chemotaxis protein [Brevibacillus fluminis]
MQDDRLYDEKELEKSWLLSYSDLITLLFVIVVVIAAVSSVQMKEKMEQVKQAQDKQEQQAKDMSNEIGIFEAKKKKLEQEITALQASRDQLAATTKPVKTEVEHHEKSMETMKTQLSGALHEFNIDFAETDAGLVIRLPEKVLFKSGSADLEEDGKKAVGAIASILQKFPNLLRIEGYSDNTPIVHSTYRTNWELSSARALSVMREMVDTYTLPPTRFVIAGWGEQHPLTPNLTQEQQAENRRVEIVILPEKEE